MVDCEKDTIFALASARGRAGVAVIRISGDKSLWAAQTLTSVGSFSAGEFQFACLRDPKDGSALDQAIVLFFSGPKSFTGEDVVELQCHGSPAVIDAIFNVLLEMGLRPAEPGEFTRRAFINGRMDLVQAEGLADLIDARTEGQRQQALQQMGGSLSQYVVKWRALLLEFLAQVEAEIDFSEEEDVPGALSARILPGISSLEQELMEHLRHAGRGKKVRDGFLIALIGPVNAGKSTLLNALSGEERAIVSNQPGTTRDVVEVETQIGGFLVTIADTAGLRKTRQKIEKEGIRRTKITANNADLRLFLLECGQERPDEMLAVAKDGDLFLHTKADLNEKAVYDEGWLLISAKTGLGMAKLQAVLQEKVEQQLSATEAPSLTRQRHVKAIDSALGFLASAKTGLCKEENLYPELVADDLRQCGICLSGLLGELGSEQILDQIFGEFCIGK